MAEHAHSCCTLLAQQKFKRGGKWHTWIDYPRFQELIERVGARVYVCTYVRVSA